MRQVDCSVPSQVPSLGSNCLMTMGSGGGEADPYLRDEAYLLAASFITANSVTVPVITVLGSNPTSFDTKDPELSWGRRSNVESFTYSMPNRRKKKLISLTRAAILVFPLPVRTADTARSQRQARHFPSFSPPDLVNPAWKGKKYLRCIEQMRTPESQNLLKIH